MTDCTVAATAPASAGGLAHEIFRTDVLPVSERFLVWRDAVLPLFDCASADRDGFVATLEGYDLKQTFFSICTFSGLRYRRTAHHPYDEGADHLLVQIYLEGGYVGENGLQPIRIEPGDVCLLDLGTTLATQARPSRVLTVVMPRDLLRSAAPGQNWQPGTVLRAGSPMANILGHHLWTVWRNLPNASADDTTAINRLVASAVAGAFATGKARSMSPVRPDGPVTLDAIRDYILQNLASPDLTPARLCRRFGCSRSQLYRLFMPMGGIAGLIRSARLERCRDELMNARPGERIVDVATRWGFASQSHFCRLFREAFGMSPGEAMELGRAAGRAAGLAVDTRPHQPVFHRWLLELRAA